MGNSKKEAGRIIVVNSLPVTLAHYQEELLSVLHGIQPDREVRVAAENGDRHDSVGGKIVAAFSIVSRRLLVMPKSRGDIYIVLWPLFGFFDIVTWAAVARHNCVAIIYHDPKPLRNQLGTSSAFARLFGTLTRRLRIVAVCHTIAARNALADVTGVSAAIAPHPIFPPASRSKGKTAKQRQGHIDSARTITVLGQYKTARSTAPLSEIAESFAGYKLQILGRGWPKVEGWITTERFLTEAEFQNAIDESTCVVIPYSHFFQSGVAVRCAESNTPVVAPRHEHLEQIFGKDWVGLVDERVGWVAAVASICDGGAWPVTTDTVFTEAVDGWRNTINRLKEHQR